MRVLTHQDLTSVLDGVVYPEPPEVTPYDLRRERAGAFAAQVAREPGAVPAGYGSGRLTGAVPA